MGDVLNAFIEYGQLLTQFAADPANFDPKQLDAATKNIRDTVFKDIYLFLGIGSAAFLAAYLFKSLWSIAGQRQSRRVRRLFLSSILSQDVSFFDDNPVGDLTTRLSSYVLE